MFIDPHVHSSGISLCSEITLKEIIDCKKNAGYDGVILTNHCQSWYYDRANYRDFMRRFLAEYQSGKDYANSKNFKLLLGIEVTITNPSYSDWLLYGITEDMILSAPIFPDLDQKSLYEYCKERDIILVQAHPFREPIHPLDPKYMDGVEINCQKRDLGFKEKVMGFAEENGLIITCGVDYHRSSSDIKGGMIIPDDIETSTDFAKYLKEGKTTVKIENEIINFNKNRSKKPN